MILCSQWDLVIGLCLKPTQNEDSASCSYVDNSCVGKKGKNKRNLDPQQEQEVYAKQVLAICKTTYNERVKKVNRAGCSWNFHVLPKPSSWTRKVWLGISSSALIMTLKAGFIKRIILDSKLSFLNSQSKCSLINYPWCDCNRTERDGSTYCLGLQEVNQTSFLFPLTIPALWTKPEKMPSSSESTANQLLNQHFCKRLLGPHHHVSHLCLIMGSWLWTLHFVQLLDLKLPVFWLLYCKVFPVSSHITFLDPFFVVDLWFVWVWHFNIYGCGLSLFSWGWGRGFT